MELALYRRTVIKSSNLKGKDNLFGTSNMIIFDHRSTKENGSFSFFKKNSTYEQQYISKQKVEHQGRHLTNYKIMENIENEQIETTRKMNKNQTWLVRLIASASDRFVKFAVNLKRLLGFFTTPQRLLHLWSASSDEFLAFTPPKFSFK